MFDPYKLLKIPFSFEEVCLSVNSIVHVARLSVTSLWSNCCASLAMAVVSTIFDSFRETITMHRQSGNTIICILFYCKVLWFTNQDSPRKYRQSWFWHELSESKFGSFIAGYDQNKIGILRGNAIRSGRRSDGSQRPQGGPQRHSCYPVQIYN